MVMFEAENLPVQVLGAPGHHSNGALNHAIELVAQKHCSVVAILSNKAVGYLNRDVIERANQLINFDHVAVVGVEIPELSEVSPIPINNTFAVWDVEKLWVVGLFDSDIGVEEMAPIGRLVRKGENLAVISSGAEVSLSLRQSADGQARHDDVKNTKSTRQLKELERVGVSVDEVLEKITVSEL